MWEDVLLHIARLTDRPETGGHLRQNLAISKIELLLATKPIHGEIIGLAKKAHDVAAFCRDWRNRRLAHRDFYLAIGDDVKPLAPASREKVRVAMSCLVKFLNIISRHYQNSEIFFEASEAEADAENILCVIDDGLRFEEKRREFVSIGKMVPFEFAPRKV